MTFYQASAICAAAFFTIGPVAASPACAPMTDAATSLPLEFLDRADPISARVSEPIETALLDAQIAGEVPAPFQKLYCDIGMFGMTIRFVQPAEDDAIHAVVTEAQYTWDAAQDPAGWVLTQMRRQPLCARGPEPFSELCP